MQQKRTDEEILHEARVRDGAKGGKKTLALYGAKHFKKMNKKRWAKSNK